MARIVSRAALVGSRKTIDMLVATLVSAGHLVSGDVSAAQDMLRDSGQRVSGSRWVEPARACDLLFEGSLEKARIALSRIAGPIDIIVQREADRKRKLLVADMDSTMICVECIDELADYAGIRDKVAEVTERAMRGELVFEEALRARVELLKGLEIELLDRCHAERVRVTPGAEALVRTMRRDGAYCLLASGGFSHFADRVAKTIGFDRAVSNNLGTANGRLTGALAGAIVGAETKKQILIDTARERGIGLQSTLAIGDGANDIPMLEAAGLGAAYRAKPKVAEIADARIAHNDLGVLLYAQGYPRKDWAS